MRGPISDSERRGPGLLMGLPLGAIAAIAVIAPALVSFTLLEIGLSGRRGGLIAVGALVGAFWLMMLIQTAYALTGASSQGR